MKKLSSLSRRTLALLLVLALILPAVSASTGTPKIQTRRTLADGLDYVNTVYESDTGSRVESFALERAANSPVEVIFLQSAGTTNGAATINKAVTRAQEMGYQVLGGINSDFFSPYGVPLGIAVEDGVYLCSPEQESVLVVSNGQMDLMGRASVGITLTNLRDDTQTSLTHFNKRRNAGGGLYLFNDDFSTVSSHTKGAEGWFVKLRVVPQYDPFSGETLSSQLTVNSTLTLEVVETFTGNQDVEIGPDMYLLTAGEESGLSAVYESFQVGDTVTLTTSCDDERLSNAQWASGCGDILVRDGMIQDSSNWTYTKDGRQPRTALGMKADGTLLLYAVDGRQSGYSNGVSEANLAAELRDQGCVWAVNLDGGGSTTMSVLLPGQDGTALVNKPSDGKARACATFLLLVTKSASRTPQRLALKNDGPVVLASTGVDLGQVVAVDEFGNTVSTGIGDVSFASNGLGFIENGHYTAGSSAGTDTITITSGTGLQGTAQVHVVSGLSGLTVTRANSTTALSSLSLEPGDSVQLAASGTYWGRTAMRDLNSLTWTIEGDVGTITPEGLFTASDQSGAKGTIVAQVFHQTVRIPVTLSNAHSDVPPGHWAYDAVEFCYQQGIVSGVSDTEFGADHTIRRGDFMLMLYRAVGQPETKAATPFQDVSATDYYAKAVAWGHANGVISGISDTEFGPKNQITREQTFTILRRALPMMGVECPDGALSALDQFQDKDQLASWAAPHAATLAEQGMLDGSKLRPKDDLTRAAMASLLYQGMTLTPQVPSEPSEPSDPSGPSEPDVPPEPQPGIPAEAMVLSQTELTLRSGESVQLEALLSPEGASGTVEWTSSDPGTLIAGASGRVANLSTQAGLVPVTVTARCGTLSASCLVYCEPASLTGTVFDAELGLNVRAGPGSSYPALGGLENGQKAIVQAVDPSGWYVILFYTEKTGVCTGYVSPDYFRLD